MIEDKDAPAGYGAFWGEVQTNVHKALGCLGTVTNGSIRDIASVAEGFQMLAGSFVPSHAYVHVVEFGLSVTVHGMRVRSGDLIHADRHGAVVVPEESIDAMAAALDDLMKREASIIAAAREAAHFPDHDRGLDQFLAKLPSRALDAPKLHVEPREVSLGTVPLGQDRTFNLQLENQGPWRYHFSIRSPIRWKVRR